jgi:hypothetical protein
LREFAFAKDAKGSYWFAAVAAQASILWGQNGRADEAKEFLERAVRAWNWAEKNGGDKEHDMHVFAASMLLRATGEDKYKRAFAAHSVYSSKPDSVPVQHGKYDQRFGSFYYALAEKADEKLKANIVKSFESEFSAWRRAAETTSYRYMRSPYSPNTWGTGGLPKWPIAPAMTMALSKNTAVKKDARQWLSFTNDFSLGCHPMNLVFTVGLGDRYVTHAWHHLMEQSPEGIIPGLQSEAAGGRFTAGERPAKGGMGGWAGMSMHPAGQWPDLYKFSEDASPGMNEGVVVTQVRAALAYGLFVAGTKDK